MHRKAYEEEDVEIVDLEPPHQRSSQALHQLFLKLPHVRAFLANTPFTMISLVGLLLLSLILVSSSSTVSGQRGRPPTSVLPMDQVLQVLDISIANGITYINNGDGTISARRAQNGNLLWQHRFTSGTYSTIEATKTILYRVISTGTGGVIEARQVQDGTLLWTRQMPPPGPSPLLVKDQVLYFDVQGGTVYALRASDGAFLWHYSSAQPMDMNSFLSVADGTASIHASDGTIHVLRAHDGSEILHYKNNNGLWLPSVENGIIYLVTDTNAVQAHRLSDGNLLWQITFPPQMLESFTVQDGNVFLKTVDGTIKALEGRNSSLLWQKRISGIVAGPFIQDKTIYYITKDNALLALRANNGSLLWQHPVNSPQYSLLLTNGAICLSQNDHVIDCWRSSDGTWLWRYTSSASINQYPRLVDGILYIKYINGTMDVLRASDGTVLWRTSPTT